MRKMRVHPLLVVVSLAVLFSATRARAESYDFSGDFGSEFSAYGDSSDTFEQSGGRLIYHNSDDFSGADTFMLHVWNSVGPGTNQSWVLTADVTVPHEAWRTVGDIDERYIGIGMGCFFEDNNFIYGLGIGNDLSTGSGGFQRYVAAETEFAGTEVFDPFPDVDGVGEKTTTEESVELRIIYSASNHTLTAMLGTLSLFSVDIDSGDGDSGSANQVDWGMDSSDSFAIGVFATSNEYPVAAAEPLQLDNLSFEITQTLKPSLVGAWEFGNGAPNASGFVAFLDNGIYFMAEDEVGTATPQDGMERGTYTWDEGTGGFVATPIVDTNGDIGLNDPFVSVTVSSDVLTLSDGVESDALNRVFSPTNGIVGGWQFGNGASNGSGVVVFLANGTYFLAEDTDESSPGEFDGMERGTYTWDPVTGAFSASAAVDTNGALGLGSSPPPYAFVTGDNIRFWDGPSGGSDSARRITYIDGKVGMVSADGELVISFEGALDSSTTLSDWAAVTPAPRSPMVITPSGGKKFFTARGK